VRARTAIAALRARLAHLARVVRIVMGVPDYERYVAHVRRHHPGEAPLSRDAFVRERLDARYARPGSRCC
jgi:uncharacterized short protein YbdD (DUF466 family)